MLPEVDIDTNKGDIKIEKRVCDSFMGANVALTYGPLIRTSARF